MLLRPDFAADRSLLALPLSRLDERSGWLAEPLGDAHDEVHVGKPGGP